MIDSLRTGGESPKNSKNNMDVRTAYSGETVQTDYVCLIANNKNGTYRVVIKKTGTTEPLTQETVRGRDNARLSGARHFTNLIGLTQPESVGAESGGRR